ncbi:putative AAA family ATPase [Plasmodium gaboni]|uniref:Putative AAA family ATPase n=1 Tax=Plasmodium gaboni TaxID=647221 RepID=A0A151LNF2_9APIC|nr:putative AAA family ATPase [Plasmodium gaboni]KYO00639.1 putative AAA family ATPase [Plasmodium gaboni]
MKKKNERKTNVEQAMSDYLLNLSQIYNQSSSFSDNDNIYNNNDINNKRYLKFNNFGIDNMMRKKGCELFLKDDINYIDNKRIQLSYYDKVMNNIFSKKEREIYRNIQNIIKTQERNDTDIEVNEYLYTYLFILAIKKMFYDIIAQKKMECYINIIRNHNINKNMYHKKDIYQSANNNLCKLKYNANEKSGQQNEHAYYSTDIKMGSHELTHNIENMQKNAQKNVQKNVKKNMKKNINNKESENNIYDDNSGEDRNVDDENKFKENLKKKNYHHELKNLDSRTTGSFNSLDYKNEDNKCDDNKCDDNKCDDNKCDDNKCNNNQCDDNKCNNNQCDDNQCGDPPKDEITYSASSNNDADKIQRNKSNNFYKNYIIFLYNKMKKNKYYWLVPLSVISCIYIYYKMRVRVCFFFKNTYINTCRFITNLFFNNNGLHGNENLILKDYNHFFNNINRNNIKTILFNPSSNTFTYMLEKNTPKTSGLMMYNSRLNNSESGTVGSSWLSSPSSSSSLSTHNNNNILYMIYYNDYIMKYLLKNKVYEHVDFRVDDKLLKLSIYDIIKRNMFDILTYTFSIITFYYIYEKNISNCNSIDYSFEKQKKLQSLNDIILNDNTKREIKTMLFFVLYSKVFNEPLNCDTILFSGDTGTGKTMLAKTIAKELNFDFVHVSGSTFIELYIGSGASKIRSLFKKAKKNNKPMVIFIDEIDSIGISRSMNNDVSISNQEYAQTLNQLLIELDSLHEYNKHHMLSEGQKQWNIFMYLKNKFIHNIYGKQNKTHNSNNNNNNNNDEYLNVKGHTIYGKNSYHNINNNNNNSWGECQINCDNEEIDENKAYDIFNYYLNNDLSLYEIEELFNLKKYRTQHFILFIGATNRYKQLDSALIRAKRFDKVIHFNLPNVNTRMKLFSFYIDKYIKTNRCYNHMNKKKNEFLISPKDHGSYMHHDSNYYDMNEKEDVFTYINETENIKDNINKYDDDNNNNNNNIPRCDSNSSNTDIYNKKIKNNNSQNKNNLIYGIQPYNNKYDEQYYNHFNYFNFNFNYNIKYGPSVKPFIINKNKKVHEKNTDIFNNIDIFTLSILTFHCNCADIDQLIYSVKSNIMTTRNIINKKEFNVNNLLMANMNDMLYKKFTYDNHLDKIVSQKNIDEQEPFSSSFNNRILNACNVDCEEYFNKFLTYCNNIFLDKIKNMREKKRNQNENIQKVSDKVLKKCSNNNDENNNNDDDNNNNDDDNNNIYCDDNNDNIYCDDNNDNIYCDNIDEQNNNEYCSNDGFKKNMNNKYFSYDEYINYNNNNNNNNRMNMKSYLSYDDLLLLYESKKIKLHLWDHNLNDIHNNNLNMHTNNSFINEQMQYYLLWKSIQTYFNTLHLNYKNISF